MYVNTLSHYEVRSGTIALFLLQYTDVSARNKGKNKATRSSLKNIGRFQPSGPSRADKVKNVGPCNVHEWFQTTFSKQIDTNSPHSQGLSLGLQK